MPGPAALYNQSLRHLEGKRTSNDLVRAFELNAEAADLGYHDAVLAMGWFLLNGFGVDKDVRAAESWYRKSARQGDARAMFSLGQMAYGDGDYRRARDWFGRAIDRGHHRSRYWLGKLYWRGHGVQKNRALAQKQFQAAARRKDPEARRLLKLLARFDAARKNTSTKGA